MWSTSAQPSLLLLLPSVPTSIYGFTFRTHLFPSKWKRSFRTHPALQLLPIFSVAFEAIPESDFAASQLPKMMSAQLQQQQQKQQQDQQQKQHKQQNQPQHQLSQQQLHQSLPSRTGSGPVSANASIAPGAAGSQIPGTPATSNTQQPASFGQLRNRAAESQSPYVRVHAKTPVAWQLLNADTLKRAQAENKPIFMHIGFLADHRMFLSLVPAGLPLPPHLAALTAAFCSPYHLPRLSPYNSRFFLQQCRCRLPELVLHPRHYRPR